MTEAMTRPAAEPSAESFEAVSPVPPPAPAPPDRPPAPGQSDAGTPAPGHEIAAILLLVALADLTLYRGYGYAGYAVLFVAAPFLLLWGAPRRHAPPGLWVVGALLLVLAARLVWLGSGLLMLCGAVLLVLFAMSLTGRRPFIPESLVYAAQSLISGAIGLARYVRALGDFGVPLPRQGWLKVLMPLAALAGFGTLFVLANPDLADTVGRGLEEVLQTVFDALARFGPQPPEFFLWLAVAWIAAGLLRPLAPDEVPEEVRSEEGAISRSAQYEAFRNTLSAVIVLFGVYLAFEFKTLWFRVFPPGFYYSGYAHQGAAWLTVALALATVVLSAIFRGAVLRDPRAPRLRRLAWIWSAENLLLAVAVYHRLLIYVGFNGMTRMRTVAFFGISTVVAGFLLVVWKIVRGRGFLWLVRRHLWALAVAVFLFAVTPVDLLVHAYNVRRILAGDPAPSVQISVHPIDAAGVLALRPLVHADDSVIRDGVRALLADRAEQAEGLSHRRRAEDWTSYQHAERLLLERLRDLEPDWRPYADSAAREDALQRFHRYAYQWY